jgi:hypothetical protein
VNGGNNNSPHLITLTLGKIEQKNYTTKVRWKYNRQIDKTQKFELWDNEPHGSHSCDSITPHSSRRILQFFLFLSHWAFHQCFPSKIWMLFLRISCICHFKQKFETNNH